MFAEINICCLYVTGQSTYKEKIQQRQYHPPTWTPLLSNFGTKRSEWDHAVMYRDSNVFLSTMNGCQCQDMLH